MNKEKLLQVFFDDPLTEFQLREISRIINLAPTSTKNYLKQLNKEQLIIITKHRLHNYPLYKANRDNEFFQLKKRLNNIERMTTSGLVTYLYEKFLPQVIILFGSCSKGEDLKHSDIDIYVQAKEEKVDLKKYEKILKKPINIIFREDPRNINENLRSNILNGDILKGYIDIFDDDDLQYQARQKKS